MNAKQIKQLKKTPDTLAKAILAMQDKLLKATPDFEAAPLTVRVMATSGAMVDKPNPVVTEYRALQHDYAVALKAYKEITGKQEEQTSNPLDGIRAMLKVAE